MEFVESEFDKQAIEIIRKNVDLIIEGAAFSNDKPDKFVLDIAPQDHVGAAKYFERAKVKTMDIDPGSGADYIADLCHQSECSPASATFDVIICTEVLEHTLNPFNAVDEIFRMLKHDGIVYATTPFNFRIHGPSPDCYRFTKSGLNELFKKFEKITIHEVPTKDRPNMPIAYNIIAKK